MQTVTDIEAYRAAYSAWQGKKVALVPTMGALHEGHLSLVRYAKQLADIVVVSIFVNPLQFGPHEDLSQYPRPLEKDLALCEAAGVDVVFLPGSEMLYPNGMVDVTTVTPPAAITRQLCGAYRPGHFIGVATVVLKLFNLLRPQVAIFGEKDAQQLNVIRQMVSDLHVPVDIVSHPIVREADGLALSSRNRYLKTSCERQAARCLYQILQAVQDQARQSASPLPSRSVLDSVSQAVLKPWENSGAAIRLEYLEAVNVHTFAPAELLDKNVKVLIAAYVNQVRLIDNLDIGNQDMIELASENQVNR